MCRSNGLGTPTRAMSEDRSGKMPVNESRGRAAGCCSSEDKCSEFARWRGADMTTSRRGPSQRLPPTFREMRVRRLALRGLVRRDLREPQDHPAASLTRPLTATLRTRSVREAGRSGALRVPAAACVVAQPDRILEQQALTHSSDTAYQERAARIRRIDQHWNPNRPSLPLDLQELSLDSMTGVEFQGHGTRAPAARRPPPGEGQSAARRRPPRPGRRRARRSPAAATRWRPPSGSC